MTRAGFGALVVLALAAGLAFALHPALVSYTPALMTEGITASLLAIVLYLARPLSAPLFALMRWLSLAVALWFFMAVPTLLLFVGAMLSGLDKSDQVTQLLKAVAQMGAFVVFMLVVGRRVFPWVLWRVAKTGSRELFTL